MLITENPEIEALYKKLQTFEFGSADAEFSFLDRLADENGWYSTYAEKVLEEYRRFLVLAIFSGHAVTSSDEVDQVWHLHLIYTQSYWDELCAKVLNKPLHHCPSDGGEQELSKFSDQYTKTLESYKEIFGENPPPEIWPTPENRFIGKEHYRRVDINKNANSVRDIIEAYIFTGLSWFGVWAVFSIGYSDSTPYVFATLFGVVILTTTLLIRATHTTEVKGSPKKSNDGGGSGSGCGSGGGG